MFKWRESCFDTFWVYLIMRESCSGFFWILWIFPKVSASFYTKFGAIIPTLYAPVSVSVSGSRYSLTSVQLSLRCVGPDPNYPMCRVLQIEFHSNFSITNLELSFLCSSLPISTGHCLSWADVVWFIDMLSLRCSLGKMACQDSFWFLISRPAFPQ